jgi:hypothetical protein
MGAEQMLGTPQTFGLREPGRLGVDLAEELRQEASAGVRGDPPRVVLGVHRVGGERSTKCALLVGEGNRSGQQTTFSVKPPALAASVGHTGLA